MIHKIFEELKDCIIEGIKKLYHKFKYLLLVVILILLILSIFWLKKENPQEIDSQQLKICDITINNWAQWITIIALPYTAGWTIYQFKKNISAKKQEKAVQIGKEFSKELINKFGIINNVYTKSSLNSFFKFNEKNYDDFKFFNVDELRKIYEDDDFPTKYIQKRREALEEMDILYHEELFHRVNSYDIDKNMQIEITVDKKEKKIEGIGKINIQPARRLTEDIFKLQNKDLPYHFFDLESDVLNQLEYICMDISSKATDSSFIYQSLHQMFLRTVRTLAVDISVNNNSFSDKYYTNIIHVYNDWTLRYKKDLKKEKRKKEKINKILNPKIKTV